MDKTCQTPLIIVITEKSKVLECCSSESKFYKDLRLVISYKSLIGTSLVQTKVFANQSTL